jgi:hypothetical protein
MHPHRGTRCRSPLIAAYLRKGKSLSFVEERGRTMRFHAPSVSASAAGDYYQLWLGPAESDGAKDDPYEVRGPYLIVQRDFEIPDHGRCYVETGNEGYVGHFRLRLTELNRTRLAFDIEGGTNERIEVSFALNASQFEEVRRIAEIVFGLREPEPSDDDAL